MPLKGDERVESIEYWPAEKGGTKDYRVSWEGDLPDRTEAEKYSIVDVCCKDNKNREFIVKMQMTWTESFKKRVLLRSTSGRLLPTGRKNASKAYVAQTKKSMAYKSLQPVYALNFVNATFLDGVDDYYHYYHLVHDKYTDQVIDGLHLIFIELPKFKPTTFSERKMQVLWLHFLTEIDEHTKEVPAELLENAEVNEALEIVEIAAFSDAEMRAYDKFWDRVSTQRTYEEEIVETLTQRVIKKVEAEANRKAEELIKEAEAKAEGKAEAKAEQQKMDTARKLKAMNVMTIEQIAEATGRARRFTVKGDTIVFHPEAFHLQEGARLDELIKQLPGVQVNDDGSLSWNGKPIRITMDGESLMGGR